MATRTPPPQGNITPNDVEFDQIRLRRQAKFNVLASINSRIFIGNGAALYISYFHKSTFYIYMSSLLLQITPKVQSLRHSGLRTVAQRLADSGTAACGQWHSGLRTAAQWLADSGTIYSVVAVTPTLFCFCLCRRSNFRRACSRVRLASVNLSSRSKFPTGYFASNHEQLTARPASWPLCPLTHEGVELVPIESPIESPASHTQESLARAVNM